MYTELYIYSINSLRNTCNISKFIRILLHIYSKTTTKMRTLSNFQLVKNFITAHSLLLLF